MRNCNSFDVAHLTQRNTKLKSSALQSDKTFFEVIEQRMSRAAQNKKGVQDKHLDYLEGTSSMKALLTAKNYSRETKSVSLHSSTFVMSHKKIVIKRIVCSTQ